MFESDLHHAEFRTLDDINQPKGVVVLFGEVLVDVFPDRQVLGGAPFNVARHLQAFGLHPVLITSVGDDEPGEKLLTAMKALGMDTRGVQIDTEHPTGQVIVHLDQLGHHFDILPNQAYDFIEAGSAGSMALKLEPELLYFGTLAQRHPVSRLALGSVLENIHCPCLLDVNLRDPWFDLATLRRSLTQANFLKLNNDELVKIAQLLCLSGSDDESKAFALKEQFDLTTVLVTCGAAGAWMLEAQQQVVSVPLETEIHVEDSVGAGDAFTAVCILGWFKNWDKSVVLQRAQEFASALCGIRGAIPADAEFYRPYVEAWGLNDGMLLQ